MMNARQNGRKGIFIVIEGTDGSGKATQFKRLAERLSSDGHEVALVDFPQYPSDSSHFVKRYLNGDYGSAEQVGPYTGSLFYALDRYDAAASIRQALDEGKVVLANRFTGSNMAHQGAKFDNAEERRGYFIWLDNLEFEMLGIPRPDMNLVLRVPAEISQQLVDKKGAREYTDKQRDLHEADIEHLKRAVEVFDDMCSLFPKDFQRIDCTRDGKLMEIGSIAKLVYGKLSPMLPIAVHPAGQAPEPITLTATATAASQAATTSAVTNTDTGTPTEATKTQQPATPPETNPYVDKGEDGLALTKAGKEYLRQAVTDADGPVYGFTEKFSAITIAAAMARLSRRGDDMRLTMMDEFAYAMDKDAQLLQRVITAYGDDSVQQLVAIPMVVEDASQLLTKKLEWGRLASYLEQSTRYIYYDQKDASGAYKYVVPESLDPAMSKAYKQAMDSIFDIYSHMVRTLTEYVRERSTVPQQDRDVAWKGATRAQACDAVRVVLPVATKSTVGLYASGQALENLIMRLLADDLPEARTTGQRLLREARKVVPAFLERADKPERGGATIAYLSGTRHGVKQLANDLLPSYHNDGSVAAVTMTDVWPRNELDVVADILYEHSDLPLRDLRDETAQWPYGKKADVLSAYIGERLNRRHRPGRALEKIHYSWDLVCDYGIFRDLQRHRMVDDLEWQELTPRLGYDVPQLVEDAGLTDMFEACFDESLALYSLLQGNGYALEAQYATLLGHKMRWKVTYNAREAFHLHELRTSPQGHPGYRKLVSQMHEKVSEVHPILAEAMRFVNKDEDPELTRLAAERYTQYKLQQLDNQPAGDVS